VHARIQACRANRAPPNRLRNQLLALASPCGYSAFLSAATSCGRWLTKGLLPASTKIQALVAHSAGNQLQLMEKNLR